jgi:hypothetical protein
LVIQKGEAEVEIDGGDDEAQFCLDDYDSGDEGNSIGGPGSGDALSPAVIALMKKCVRTTTLARKETNCEVD